MIPLTVRGKPEGVPSPIVGSVSRHPGLAETLWVTDASSGSHPARALVTTGGGEGVGPQIHGLPFLSHLEDGDLVVLHPNGRLDTLFRISSQDNSLFVTSRCNSNCLMCSQPPRDFDDLDYQFAINQRLIERIPVSTELLGITGGEPTLLGWRLLKHLHLLRTRLPQTEIHVLTNGRIFAWPKVAAAISEAAGHRVMFGIPLYSDYYVDHDFVVQAKDAFDQTLLGLHNLARVGGRVEIRVVLHKATVPRLVSLAQFIHKNLPFAEHVALMGLEFVGYTPANKDRLWIEPEEYEAQLAEAVSYLADFGFNVSIYNLPLCLLPEELWPFARRSISAWKREYVEVCLDCSQRDACGGVFGTSRRQSERLHAL